MLPTMPGGSLVLIWVEAAGRIDGGIGGLLPDWIDTPCFPRHRAEAHSMSITGTVGYYMNQRLPQWQVNLRAEAQRCAKLSAASTSMWPQIGYSALELIFRFLSGLLAGLLAGYASHLALDPLTRGSLRVLC
jgi:hypothetical protein